MERNGGLIDGAVSYPSSQAVMYHGRPLWLYNNKVHDFRNGAKRLCQLDKQTSADETTIPKRLQEALGSKDAFGLVKAILAGGKRGLECDTLEVLMTIYPCNKSADQVLTTSLADSSAEITVMHYLPFWKLGVY